MINLLPVEVKRDIRAARMNVVLLRYNMFIAGAIIALGLLCLGIYVVLRNSQASAQDTNEANLAKAARYAYVRQEADTYKKNLAIAKSIFSNANSYTDVINAITKLIPNGVVLDSINLNAGTFGSQNSYSAHAKNYAAATQLKTNFQQSTMFTEVHFQALTNADGNNGGAAANSAYPISVVISAKLNKVSM